MRIRVMMIQRNYIIIMLLCIRREHNSFIIHIPHYTVAICPHTCHRCHPVNYNMCATVRPANALPTHSHTHTLLVANIRKTYVYILCF